MNNYINQTLFLYELENNFHTRASSDKCHFHTIRNKSLISLLFLQQDQGSYISLLSKYFLFLGICQAVNEDETNEKKIINNDCLTMINVFRYKSNYFWREKLISHLRFFITDIKISFIIMI